jgi:hypothetical protein
MSIFHDARRKFYQSRMKHLSDVGSDECSGGRRKLVCVLEHPTLASIVACLGVCVHLTLGVSDASAWDTPIVG